MRDAGLLSDAGRLGVYVSVPFCRAKCSFCNFASGVSSAEAIERYVGQLCAEIERVAETAQAVGAVLAGPRVRTRGTRPFVDTIYFGGGTPSLLAPEQLRRIFAALRRVFAIEDGAEITLEAAPGQIADAVLDEAMRLGVNRVSLGVQSFVDREGAAVGRLHTERECVREIARLRAAGLSEVGADLISGLPYQTAASWEHSLEAAVGCGLTHLSVYMLEVDEDSRLGSEVIAGGTRFHAHAVPQEEISAELYERACEMLPEHGFAQYEISNFAGVSHRSKHNCKYWTREPYVGFGLDAHSMLLTRGGAVRFANPDELSLYGKGEREVTVVGEREALEERMFLGLRMVEGVSVAGLEAMSGQVVEMVEEGLMVEEDGRWKLTLRGRLVSNEVFGRLMEGVAV